MARKKGTTSKAGARAPSRKVSGRKAAAPQKSVAPSRPSGGGPPPKAAAPARALSTTTPARAPLASAALKNVDGTQPPTLPIDEFFDQVGEGVVKAQQKMDLRSLDYVKGVAGQPNILPSLFRIPKVSADLKFALDTSEDHVKGLIFFKDESSQQTRNQQSIQFEIVSVPATQLPPAPLFISLVFSAVQRGVIFDALAKVADPGTQLLRDNQKRVIIYAPDGDRGYFLAFAADGADTQVGIWYLVMGNPPTLITLRKPGDASPSIGPLHTMLLQQGKTQEDFLNRLGG